MVHPSLATASAFIFCLSLLEAQPVAIRPEENWSKVEGRHFTLLSSAPDRPTLDWAVELEGYFELLDEMLPIDEKSRSSLTVVLFKDDALFAPLKPLIPGRAPRTAYFWLNPNGTVIGLSVTDKPSDARRLIYHEGMHWIMGQYAHKLPVWFEEGFAEVLSSFAPESKQASIGLPVALHMQTLRRDGLMTTSELLRQGRESVLYDESFRMTRLYAQAWLTVHALVFEKQDGRRGGAVRYWAETHEATPTVEAFERSFGVTCEQMDVELAAYLKAGRFGVRRTPLDREKVVGQLRRSSAQPWEIDIALGRMAVYARHRDEGRRMLNAAIRKKSDNPDAYFWLGDIAMADKEYDSAKDYFEKAIAAGADHQAVYYMHAAAALREIHPDGSIRDLEPGQLRGMADDMIRAVSRAPWNRAAYDFHATLLPAIAEPTPNDRLILAAGLERWPQSYTLLLAQARVEQKAARPAEATAAWEKILALKPPAPQNVRDFARRQVAASQQRNRSEEIQRLMEAREYGKLLERLDVILQEVPALERPMWEKFREQARLREKFDRIEGLLKEGHQEEVETILREIAASKAIDLFTKLQAQEMLKKIGR